jgi:hypothetical protein
MLATARLYLADQMVGLRSGMKLSAIELKDVIPGNVPGTHMSPSGVPTSSVSWPRVGVLGLGVTSVWQSVADGWEPSRDILAMKDTVMGARGENRTL